ncbi:MAG: 4-(cytidine 5'-diphospho)-2-C-methyl-D-erythritol kinase [Acutalibacteraceae bacterium]|jgi:4-diphosphocytidyl-2-C-methyl-D-erythritol kinase
MRRVTVFAPAKINLTLDVAGKRPDGYHELRSVMHAVDLGDTLTVARRERPGIGLWLSDPELPAGADNTVYKAAAALLALAGDPFGVEIRVDKRVPRQAGLAGGSADAAGTLVGINALLDGRFSAKELEAVAATVGADVPFCLRGGCALAEGIGEKLMTLPPLPAWTAILCKPPVGVSTPEAYRLVDGAKKDPATDRMLKALKSGDPGGIGRALGNDFEAALALPEVAAIRAAMERFSPLGSRMTGSGSAVYALFESDPPARDCAAALDGMGEVFWCHPYALGPTVVKEEEV